MIKVFVSQDDKIHLTKEEIEKLLEEAFDEGYVKGKNSLNITPYIPTINSPITLPYTPTCDEHTITTTESTKPLVISYKDFDKAFKQEKKKNGRK